MKHIRVKDRRGASNLTVLVFGAIVVATIYTLFQIIPMYYRFFEIQSQMETIIHVADKETDPEIRRKLMYHIKKQDIPVEPEDLRIERDGSILRLSLDWEDVFSVPFFGKEYEIYTFEFNAHAEGEYK